MTVIMATPCHHLPYTTCWNEHSRHKTMNATADMVESKKAIHRNRTRNRDDLGSVSGISTQKHSFDGGSSGGSCTDDSFLHMLKASRRQNAVQKPSINVVRDG